jgi:DNA-binding transcriptional LysR family regulator
MRASLPSPLHAVKDRNDSLHAVSAYNAGMDIVAACRVFVQVGEHGSFTLGAAAARVPQSVASRRVAALEEHFGERLFDRSARRAALTPFGRDMLPPARRLVQLAEAMEYHAEQARLRPLSLAVPETCSVRSLAMLNTAAHEHGIVLDFRRAGPAERAELAATGQVRAALVTMPHGEAEWTVPLGAASAATTPPAAGEGGPFRVESLRPGRTRHPPRRIWIQPEDDVPHIRDHLQQIGHRAALMPAQISVAASLVAAASEALRGADLLLCSAAQARELGLRYRALAGAPVARGYRMSVAAGDDPDRLRAGLGDAIARALDAGPRRRTGEERTGEKGAGT